MDDPTPRDDGQTRDPEPTPTPTYVGPSVKMVPESDLLAVKRAREKDAESFKKVHDDLYLKHLDLETRFGEVEEKANRVPTLETQLAEAHSRLYVSEVARNEAAAASVEVRRASLVREYKLNPDDLKDMTATDLDSMEKTLKLVAKPRGDNIAGATPPGGSPAPSTHLESIQQEIAKYRERHNMPRKD